MVHRALIAEPQPHLAAVLRKFLEAAGFKVMRVGSFEDAEVEVKEVEPDLVFTSHSPQFHGEVLCKKLKELSPAMPVVLLYPPEQEDPEHDANAAGADAYLVAPLKKGTVVSCARTMVRLRSLKAQVSALEADLKKHITELPEETLGAGGVSADFAFFKKFLLMEVKRSRRYRYPVSFLLVGIDRFVEKTQALDAKTRTEVLAEALSLIARGVRDIDLAVPYVDGKFLVFLPHTPRDGAVIVAMRARERLAKLEKARHLTSSIGIASFEPGPNMPPVSFGSLMKDAADALRKAQESGGNKIEGAGRIKRDRISMG